MVERDYCFTEIMSPVLHHTRRDKHEDRSVNYLQAVLSHTIEQVLVLLVPTLVIAFAMHLVAERNWRYGERLVGRWTFAVFTAIGTMVHELSHALACVIFRHKIQDIALFKPDPVDQSLGYVHHSYDRNSLYQRMGNFPIGIAPIFGGGLALALVLLAFGEWDALKSILGEPAGTKGPVETLIRSMELAWDAATLVVRRNQIFSLKTVLFLYLVFCVGSNVSLSSADIKGAMPAVPLVLALVLAINLLLAWLPVYATIVTWIVAVGASCLSLLVIVLAINSILLAILWGVSHALGHD